MLTRITATGWAAFCPPWGRIARCRPPRSRACSAIYRTSLFAVHNWRTDVVTLGELPASFIQEQSGGLLDYTWPAQVNRMIPEGNFDLVLSIGQVVPHEVIGLANYNKNILVGTAGPLSIHRSHYLGAVVGMERIMGRMDNPVRRVLNRASDEFLRNIPIVYVLTVIGTKPSRRVGGARPLRGR